MFNFFGGGKKNHRNKDSCVQELLGKHPGARQTQEGVEVPFDLTGVGQVAVRLVLPANFPSARPQVFFDGKGTMRHPIIGEGGAITQLPELAQWNTQGKLADIVGSVIQSLLLQPPEVFFQGEEPVLLKRNPGEVFGCTISENLVLTEVAPGTPAARSSMARFIGRKCKRVNNVEVNLLSTLVNSLEGQCVVLSFDLKTHPDYSQLQPVVLPDVPSSFQLTSLSAAKLSELSESHEALTKFFEATPFYVRCRAAVTEREDFVAKLEQKKAAAEERAKEAELQQRTSKEQVDELQLQLSSLRSRVDEVTSQLSPQALLRLLDEKITEAVAQSESLEEILESGTATPATEAKYKEARKQYHLAVQKKKALTADQLYPEAM